MVYTSFSDMLYFIGANEASWSMTSDGLMIKDGGFGIWEADSADVAFLAENVACSVIFSSETEGYLCNQIGIYQFSMEDQSRKQIFNFNDAGMEPGAVSPIRMMDMSVGEDGTLFVLCEYIDGKGWFAKLAKHTAEAGKAAAEKRRLELAIVAADSYLKKAIVDFNKHLAQADSMLEGHAVSGYPVRNSALEELFTNLHEEARLRVQEDDVEENVLSLTSEQYDKLWEVLESAHLYDNETGMVLDILLEETGAYWTGIKSSQQVMEIVNNRVQLYLDEER